MTDQNISEDVRKIVNDMRYHANHDNVRGSEEEYIRYFADRLETLLPAPPTLADMLWSERDKCAGMQADLVYGDRVVLLNGYPDCNGMVQVMDKGLEVCREHPKNITPRRDLPRLEWPDDTSTGPGHLAVGTVIESADDPRIDALPLGSILLDREEEATTKRIASWAGIGYAPDKGEGTEYGPWTVLHIPKEDGQ